MAACKLRKILLHVFPEDRREIVGHDCWEARLKVIDEDGPPSQLPDAELLSGFHDGVVDLARVLTGTLQSRSRPRQPCPGGGPGPRDR